MSDWRKWKMASGLAIINRFFWLIFGIGLLILGLSMKPDADRMENEFNEKCGADWRHSTDPAFTRECKLLDDNLSHQKAGVYVWTIMGLGFVVFGMVQLFMWWRKTVEQAKDWQRTQREPSPSSQVDNYYQQSLQQEDPNFVPPVAEKWTCPGCGAQTTERTCPYCGKSIK